MILDFSSGVKDQGQPYGFEVLVTLPHVDVMSDDVGFENVSVKGEYIAAEEAVNVKATVSATVSTRCSLCLSPVKFPVKAKLDATYLRQIPPDDPDAYIMDGYAADIDKAVMDALLLELPMRIVCREDCKGLCPVCGVNRNVERCICQEGGERLNPFSALSEMLSKNKEV